MKKLSEEVSTTISKELLLSSNDNFIKNIDKIIRDMKSTGLIKTPTYTLPMVDTIGKNYFSLNSKQK
jgi:hypothetical protein